MKNILSTTKVFILIVALFAILLVLPPQPATADSSGSIAGFVYDLNELPITVGYVCASLDVIGIPAGTGCSPLTVEGYYVINNLAPGNYAVWWEGDAAYARMAYPNNVVFLENVATIPVNDIPITLNDMYLEEGGSLAFDTVDSHDINRLVTKPHYKIIVDDQSYMEGIGGDQGHTLIISLPLNHAIKIEVWGGSSEICIDPSRWQGSILCYDHQWYQDKTDPADATPIQLTETTPYLILENISLEPLMGAISGVVLQTNFSGYVCAAAIPYEVKGCNNTPLNPEDGAYKIESLPPGEYTVWFGGDENYVQMTYLSNIYFWPDYPGTVKITVTAGGIAAVPQIMELEPAGSIDVTMVDGATGQPIPLAKYFLKVDDYVVVEVDGDSSSSFKYLPLGHPITMTGWNADYYACGGPCYLRYWTPPFILTQENRHKEYVFRMFPLIETPAGIDVPVSLASPAPIALTFDAIGTSGYSAAREADPGEYDLSSDFELVGKIYDIYTDAVYSGNVRVCFAYNDTNMTLQEEMDLELRHHSGGSWVDVTSAGYPDIVNNKICGSVTELSPFAVVKSPHPPTLGSISVSGSLLPVGAGITANAGFSDSGQNDAYLAKWNWGDGSTSAGTLMGTEVSGSHIYTSPGVYSVTLILTDGLGSQDQASYQYMVVYDPSGGFVTGGGTIHSPAGAYTLSPTLTGTANFGFVAKYQKGANVPGGSTEFQFAIAGLNFKSTSYEWLVVAGSKAQYKGSGAVNGVTGYKFLLSALDADQKQNNSVILDSFRIKIWDAATGLVIYDNQSGASDDSDAATVLLHGSIVIHK